VIIWGHHVCFHKLYFPFCLKTDSRGVFYLLITCYNINLSICLQILSKRFGRNDTFVLKDVRKLLQEDRPSDCTE